MYVQEASIKSYIYIARQIIVIVKILRQNSFTKHENFILCLENDIGCGPSSWLMESVGPLQRSVPFPSNGKVDVLNIVTKIFSLDIQSLRKWKRAVY